MNCADCGKSMTTQEQVTFSNRCEDCWACGKGFGTVGAAECYSGGYFGGYYDTTDLKRASSSVSYGPNRVGRLRRHER